MRLKTPYRATVHTVYPCSLGVYIYFLALLVKYYAKAGNYQHAGWG